MYYQKDIECASPEQIRAWQDERLVKTVKRVWDNCEYYRNKMKDKGVEYGDIKSADDLWKLPFVTKDDLREAYPYGLMSSPLSDCIRIHSTSGTTGKRVLAFYTKNDIDLWDDCCARAIAAAGGTREDIVQICYGYGLFTGGFGLNGGSQKLGQSHSPHVFRQHGKTAPVHDRPRLDNTLLYSLIRRVSCRIHRRKRTPR